MGLDIVFWRRLQLFAAKVQVKDAKLEEDRQHILRVASEQVCGVMDTNQLIGWGGKVGTIVYCGGCGKETGEKYNCTNKMCKSNQKPSKENSALKSFKAITNNTKTRKNNGRETQTPN